jgi:hypothetical protein
MNNINREKEIRAEDEEQKRDDFVPWPATIGIMEQGQMEEGQHHTKE